METEIWKKIDNYDNYEISNMGRVKNVKINRICKGCVSDGYIRVKLSKQK